MTAAATSRELLLDLQRRMLVIRAFEDEVMRLFMQNLVRGSTKATEGLHERGRPARGRMMPTVDSIVAALRGLCAQ
jgi:TPP-dependent pyruvate/acetoin dehydrogenase alpha subunit